MASKQSQHGSSKEHAGRTVRPAQQSLLDILSRGQLGQMVNPPNTQIAAPLQQAVSNLQGGFPAMRQTFGLGGGLADQLAGQGGGGAMLPGPNQAGLQSREQLGLPDRKSYFTFVPSADQVAALGAVPGVHPNKQTAKAQKKQGTKPTPDERSGLAHPELNR